MTKKDQPELTGSVGVNQFAYSLYVPGNEVRGDHAQHGVTLRQYYAAKAMAALVSSAMISALITGKPIAAELMDTVPEGAFEIADAMIEAEND